MANASWSNEDDDYIRAHLSDTPKQLAAYFGGKHGNQDVYRAKRNRERGKRLQEAGVAEPVSPLVSERLGKIADLMERSGIDPNSIGRVETIRLKNWQGLIKNNDNEAEVVDLEASSVVLSPTWDDGPKWPVVEPAPPMQVCHAPRAVVQQDGEKTVVVPDAQMGYYRDEDTGELHTTHDERALYIALQVIARCRPARVILAGDIIDLPEASRYRKEPAFQRTTQATINRASQFVAQVRAAAGPDAEIIWMEGNHEIRMQNYIKDNAMAAYGLKQANVPASWPVLSVPHLCRLDDLDCSYLAGWPANKFWLSDRLRIVHGNKATKGSNAHAYLKDSRTSVIFFHSHRREWAEETRISRNGPRTIMAANPGCLCRIDGVVPSANSGTDLSGMPVEDWQNWQQGLAVITVESDDGPFVYEPVEIHHGIGWWRGEKIVAPCDVEHQEEKAA